jgi:polyhydroxyalkanoate synthesis regulator protein
MAMFQAAAEAFIPKAATAKSPPAASEVDDLAQLRAQMKAMQDKLDRIGG